MASVVVPGLDLAPSVPSRIVTVSLVDLTEGIPAEGAKIDFILPADLHVPSDGVILQAGRVTLTLDADGRGEIRLPCYSDKARPDGWVIGVKKHWAPETYFIRVPVGSTRISLANIEEVREATAGMVSWMITGAGVEVVEGTSDQWNITTTTSGGVVTFRVVTPVGITAAQAKSAVDVAVAAQGLVAGDASQLLQGAISSDYAIAFSDQDGRVAGGVTENGQFNFEAAPTVLGAEGVTLVPVVAPGYAIVFCDQDGYIAGGITPSGQVTWEGSGGTPGSGSALTPGQMLALTRSRNDAVSAIGDSMTAGYFASGDQAAQSWPSQFKTLAGSGVTVTNLGRSGWTCDDIETLIGSTPITVTPTGGTIPATGPVSVTVATPAVFSSGSRSFPGSLAGVPGTLMKNESQEWTFTRSGAGTATPVPAGTRFVSSFAIRARDTLVILLGRNDVSNSVIGRDGSVKDHVVGGIRRITQWAEAQAAQILVLSVLTRTSEPVGDVRHTQITQINEALAAEHGPRFLDLRSWLISNGLDALGLTPTSADQAAITGDTLPPSLMDPQPGGGHDATHWSPQTASLVAQQIHTWMSHRDWLTN